MKRGAISVIRLKRCLIYRPLAAILAVLVVPIFSGFGGDSAIRALQASAEVICLPSSPCNPIIQHPGIGPIAADLGQLERDAVQAYLGLHKLPAGDSTIIYKYGRADLRNAIRGVMFDILLGIINTPAAERTRHEQALYQWLQSKVQQNEIEEYRVAIAEFHHWQNEPCTFALDSVIAKEYKLSYNGAPFCGRNFTNLFLAPDVPDQTYFTAFGLKNSYGKPASEFPYFGSLVADMGINVAAVAGISAGIGAVVVAGAGALLAKSLALALAKVTVLVKTVDASTSAALVLGSSTIKFIGPAAIVGGAVTIVLIAIAIGVAAGIRVFSNQANLNALNNLNNDLKRATDTPPDLTAFATDSSGLGMYKLQTTMAAQSVPDVPATAKLPLHSNSDFNFAIQKATESKPTVDTTLAYQYWNGSDWSAQTWGGWFVQNCNSPGKCAQADSINPNLRYVDRLGVNWSAMRFGDKFISVKNKPASTDKDCEPDPATGVSAGPDFSKCKSYYSNSIELKAPGGVLEVVSLSMEQPLRPPVFTSEPTLPFTPGVPSSQTITVSGHPTPQICVSSSDPPLPADFSLNGGMCGQDGRFQLAFNGNPGSPQRIYKLTLAASNGTTATPVLQTFTIDVSEKLGITSPSMLTGTAAFPVNFQVTATGIPPLSLSVSPSLLDHFPGLKFIDNGNGTGTISGTSEVPGHWACLSISGTASCGVIASNSQGTIIQGFGINLVPAPAATLGLPAEATFLAGVSNSVKVTSIGARTHVSWNFKSAPPWLVLVDNGDSTATLLGNPPAGTSGTFTAEIAPIAAGSAASVRPVFTSFLVTVVNQPLFLSPNTATFTVGSEGSFAISASEGNIGISGTLPAGLSFTGGNPARITGTPVPGSGGQYQFNLTDSLPSGVSIYGSLILNVHEAPSIISGNKANFPSGLPGSFTVTTFGFPSVSAQPVAQPLTPPTGPTQGKGMYFTVTGLPASLKASNLNPQGYATGALTIEGTPSPGEAGTYKVQIMASNGVGASADQTLILKILKLASVPASGAECFGAYTGVFTGDIGVSAGQNCMFVGGSVIGNVTVIGGDFVLSHAKVTGNVEIQGWSEFSIGSDSEIGGNLTVQDLTLNLCNLCASRVAGNVLVLNNAIPIEIGSSRSSCPGNIIGGNLAITNNWDSIDVHNNQITRTLSCSGNLSIAGSNNPAQAKEGQCISF